MEKQLTSVCTKLGNISQRMDSLEGRQKALEDEVKASGSVSSSSVCTPEPGPRVRRRVTPTALQVIFIYVKSINACIIHYNYFFRVKFVMFIHNLRSKINLYLQSRMLFIVYTAITHIYTLYECSLLQNQ